MQYTNGFNSSFLPRMRKKAINSKIQKLESNTKAERHKHFCVPTWNNHSLTRSINRTKNHYCLFNAGGTVWRENATKNNLVLTLILASLILLGFFSWMFVFVNSQLVTPSILGLWVDNSPTQVNRVVTFTALIRGPTQYGLDPFQLTLNVT